MCKTPLEQELAYERGRDTMEAEREMEIEKELDMELESGARSWISVVIARLTMLEKNTNMTGEERAMTLAGILLDAAEAILAVDRDYLRGAIHEARKGEV